MPRAAATGGAKKRAAPKTTKLAEEFTPGTVITDVLKKQWKLGRVIGQGGFGLVYHANTADSPNVTQTNAQYVVKIEPGGNGPLFCEMNFYIRAAKNESIQEYIKSHRLKYLAVPPYIGSGMHTYNSVSYRFLVMPRYGTDLQKVLIAGGGTFQATTVFSIGLRMIDALQYLHEKEYVHADIKASNILLGFNGHTEDKNQVYLADYGLAYRYTANSEHKEYVPDPKNAHNGSIEFTSRDAHVGVFPSRRGDLEILGYCLLQWLCGKLPWEHNLTDCSFVAQKKVEYMLDVEFLVKTCFPGPVTHSSDCMRQYLMEVNRLGYQEEPNYRKLKDLLKLGLNKAGQKDEWQINFHTESQSRKRKSVGTESPKPSPKKKTKAVADKPIPKATTQSPKSTAARKLPKATPKLPKTVPARKLPKATTAIKLPKPTITCPKTSAVHGSPRVVKSPLIQKTVANGMSSSTPSPRKRSPVKKPSTSFTRKGFNSSTMKNKYQIPPPTKAKATVKSPATPKQSTSTAKTVRRVKRVNVPRTDASIQTTPGLKTNI